MSCICDPGERLKCLSVDRSINPEDVAGFDDEQLDDKELAAKRLYLRQQALIKMYHDIETEKRNRVFELHRLRIAAEALKKHSNSESGIVIKDPTLSITYSQGTTEQRMAEDRRIFLENQKEIARQKEVYWPEEEKVRQEKIKAAELAAEVFEKYRIDWPEKKYVDSFWESVINIPILIFELIKYEIKNYIISIKERYDL